MFAVSILATTQGFFELILAIRLPLRQYINDGYLGGADSKRFRLW